MLGRLIAGLLVALAVTAPASAVVLVTNGGFEDGLDGWTRTGNTGLTSLTFVSGAAQFHTEGDAGLVSGSKIQPAGITQDITTIAGREYVVSFDLRNLLGPITVPFIGTIGNFFQASFGSPILTLTNVPAFGFTHYEFTTLATLSSTPLSFAFRNDRPLGGWAIDNIAVSLVAVPEPATWGLMIAGFAAAGLWARRRAKAASLATATAR